MLNLPKKAVVFDLGGVVIDWRPGAHAMALLPDVPEPLATSLVFQDFAADSDWVQFDRGGLNAEQTATRIAQRCGLPPHRAMDWLMSIPENFRLIPETVAWIQKIKDAGFQRFFLSNMPTEFAAALRKRKDFLSLFDNGIFSGEIGIAKPDFAIYKFAEREFNLQHEKGWHFLDDHLPNIKAAIEVGWHASHFKSPNDLIDLESTQLFKPLRPIRSYVLRGGRIGSGQAHALESLSQDFCIEFGRHTLSAESWLAGDRAKPLIVEIGFGMGHSTAAMARSMPAFRHLGIEVHPPGVGSLLSEVRDQGITNLRIIQHDAVEVLETMIVSDSVHAFHIYFPDPWPKKRHQKRRLIQRNFVSLLASRLVSGGYLHCATDWEAYAFQMLQVLSEESSLINAATAFSARPTWRVKTKFERRGLALGHQVWDLVFYKGPTNHA